MSKSYQDYYKDKEYARYLHSGEALAVAVLKGSDKCKWANRKTWIDIVDMETFEKKVPLVQQASDSKDWERKRCFNWIVAETFPRKTKPQYVEENDDYNRYLTWNAANNDIRRARQNGYKGKLYLTLIAVRKESKNTARTKEYDRPLRDERARLKWLYDVVGEIEISKKQLETIKRERQSIVDKIRANRGAKLSHFPLKP